MLRKGEIKRLYSGGLSMKEIGDRLGIGERRVGYWMNKYNIPRRSIGDAIYIKRNPKGDPFELKKEFTKQDLVLLGIGLGLWWGEGTKANKHKVRLGNTDPAVIQAFIQFLIHICGVKLRDMRFGLQIFSDMPADEALRFWVDVVGVNREQFYKVTVTPARSIGTYRQKTRHGVLTIYAGNRNLRRLIDNLLAKYAVVAQ